MDAALAGKLILIAALGTALWAAGFSIVGHHRRDARLVASGRRALVGSATLIAAATILLLLALAARDFSLSYVANYTSLSTPRIFAFTALWAGMEGSLLFWTLLTALYAAGSVMNSRSQSDLVAIATAVLAGIEVFLIGVLVFGANPFDATSSVLTDGAGLNPLLQSPFMAIHPVMLYLGLTGFAVPFAFAASSLVAGRTDSVWFSTTRRSTVMAWSFLTIGIILGGAWAYLELGWGGYWAWDPVENSSLLPWLTATAFLHSVIIQERRGMLKIWNFGLILATYCLAIFGTFLTRSGLLLSVHTFSESPVGKAFLPFLGILLVSAFGVLGWRFERLRAERHLDSLASREAMFLFNNLFFVAIAFTVLWGTIYPVFVEAISGKRISVGPPFFNTVVTPLGLALLGLAGIGPLIAWRRATPSSLRRQFAVPLTAGTATIAALWAAGVRSTGAMLAIALGAFVVVGTIGEFLSGARAHRGPGPLGLLRGLAQTVGRNRRRYGGYIVHLGVVLIFIGLAGNAFKQSWSGELAPGSSFQIGRYEIEYESSRVFATKEKMVNMAVMKVSSNGRSLTTLSPQRNFHFAQRQPQSEVGLRTSLADDLYLVLTQMDSSRKVTLRAFVNPLVIWIWIGGSVMAAGMLVILSGERPVGGRRFGPPQGARTPTRSEPFPAGHRGQFPSRTQALPSHVARRETSDLPGSPVE